MWIILLGLWNLDARDYHDREAATANWKRLGPLAVLAQVDTVEGESRRDTLVWRYSWILDGLRLFGGGPPTYCDAEEWVGRSDLTAFCARFGYPRHNGFDIPRWLEPPWSGPDEVHDTLSLLGALYGRR